MAQSAKEYLVNCIDYNQINVVVDDSNTWNAAHQYQTTEFYASANMLLIFAVILLFI